MTLVCNALRLMENKTAESAERMRMIRAQRQQRGLGELCPVVPDQRKDKKYYVLLSQVVQSHF